MQQIPHQGGELVFSLSAPLICLFKGYSDREHEGKKSFPGQEHAAKCHRLQHSSQTLPGSLHPQTQARSLFNTSQQTPRLFIPQRHNLSKRNKFTFSLKILLCVQPTEYIST